MIYNIVHLWSSPENGFGKRQTKQATSLSSTTPSTFYTVVRSAMQTQRIILFSVYEHCSPIFFELSRAVFLPRCRLYNS
jgi:hypothetical protein